MDQGLRGWELDSPSQASRRIGRPIDDAVLVAGEQLPSRDAVLDFVRSLPNGLAGSTLALFLGSDFKLLALDRLGEGNATDCNLKPHRLAARGAALGATGFLVVHHAPARCSRPTPEEYAITKEIRRAGEDLDVHLLEHLILTRAGVKDINP